MPIFKGFEPEDFDELAGSTWRGRDALGGVLTKTLNQQTGRPYKSWAVRRRLELHIAQEGQYDFDDPWPYTKLFIYTRHELAFGFYIECPELSGKRDNPEKYIHWNNFKYSLQHNSVMRAALLAAMANHVLTLADYYRPETGGALQCKFAFHEGRLQQHRTADQAWHDIEIRDMVRRITKLPEDEWVDLHVFASIEKQQAIDMGPKVITPILKVFRALTPVYEATTNPG